VAKVCIATIFGLYCFEVFGRYVLGMGTWLANEYVPYAVCAATFLMMPAVTRGKGHVAIGVLENLIPARFALHGKALVLVISLVVCSVIAWIALMENFRQVAQDVNLLRVRQTPKIYVSVWITYGFTSSAVYFLRMLTAIREFPTPSAGEIETL
jgi:TRAP-type C4-dicarboxylate transport system permease small subunit